MIIDRWLRRRYPRLRILRIHYLLGYLIVGWSGAFLLGYASLDKLPELNETPLLRTSVALAAAGAAVWWTAVQWRDRQELPAGQAPGLLWSVVVGALCAACWLFPPFAFDAGRIERARQSAPEHAFFADVESLSPDNIHETLAAIEKFSFHTCNGLYGKYDVEHDWKAAWWSVQQRYLGLSASELENLQRNCGDYESGVMGMRFQDTMEQLARIHGYTPTTLYHFPAATMMIAFALLLGACASMGSFSRPVPTLGAIMVMLVAVLIVESYLPNRNNSDFFFGIASAPVALTLVGWFVKRRYAWLSLIHALALAAPGVFVFGAMEVEPYDASLERFTVLFWLLPAMALLAELLTARYRRLPH